MIGQTISHYRILKKLGEGGMGVVFVAEDTHLGRRVAIKFLSETSNNNYHFRARFLREARAVSAITHPHIATIYDYGETPDGHPFIVMELIKGRTLGELLHESGLTLTRALEIVEQVAEGLGEAHARGIVHRDIKPSNVLINERGQAKVLDFGLAKQLDEDRAESDTDTSTLLSTRTQSDVVVGTPLYLSPEQATSAPVDARSDLFALGALLYECITGRPAFSGASVLEIGAQVIHITPPVPSQINERVPKKLDRVAMKALEKRPEDRYQSAAAMLEDLRRVRLSLSDNDAHRIKRVAAASTVKGTQTSALMALTETLREPRLSIFTMFLIALAVGLVGLVGWKYLRPGPHRPSAEAERLYKEGTDALRDGAYFRASQALERAISTDSNFPLAHARLAESWIELDYTDKAKDELLRVTTLVPDRSVLPRAEQLYLKAIHATVSNELAQAVESYREIALLMPDQPQVYLDLGRAFEKNGERDKALENYMEAINRDSHYATAYLRVGILYGQKQDTQSALAAFEKADGLYQALGNIEGRTEVSYQRGLLFDMTGKVTEAQGELQRALETARVSNNEHQQIKAILQLSSVAYSAGNVAQAREYARQAVELAKVKGMENLTARGLVELGTAFMTSGDFNEAENYFKQALDFAQRYKGRRSEARALFLLGSLRMQQGRPEEAVPYLESALAFYKQNGFRDETSKLVLLLGRAKRQKGDYESALKDFEQELKRAEQVGNLALAASLHRDIGQVLARQGRYVEALSHADVSYATNKTLGDQFKLGYNLMDRGNLLWWLGRYQEARSLFDEALKLVNQSKGGNKALQADLIECDAEMSMSERRLAEARAKAQKALSLAGEQYQDTAIQARLVLSLGQVFSGAAREGRRSCEQAVAMAVRAGDSWLTFKATLALAEAMLASGDAPGALTAALRAQESFARTGNLESEWRAWFAAALASQLTGDQAKAHEYAFHATESLTKLEQQWGAEAFKGYISRPDIRDSHKRLDQFR